MKYPGKRYLEVLMAKIGIPRLLLVLQIFLCSGCAGIPVAAEKGKSSVAIAIKLDVHSQLTVMQSFVAEKVFYIKLDSKEDSLKKNQVIASSYQDCPFFDELFGVCKDTFLLNVEPGVYAAVGAYGKAGTVETTVFFPEDVIKSTVLAGC